VTIAMRTQGVAALPVVDAAARVVGVLTEDRSAGTTVGELMNPVTVAIGPEAALPAAAALMRDRGLRMLPVVVDGALAGVLTASDVVEPFMPAPGPSVGDVTDDQLVAELPAACARSPGHPDTRSMSPRMMTLSGWTASSRAAFSGPRS
jgi:CBS-domain-containing membrane protein